MRRMAVMWWRWSRAVDGGEVGERMGGDGGSCPPSALHAPDIVPRSRHVLSPQTHATPMGKF